MGKSRGAGVARRQQTGPGESLRRFLRGVEDKQAGSPASNMAPAEKKKGGGACRGSRSRSPGPSKAGGNMNGGNRGEPRGSTKAASASPVRSPLGKGIDQREERQPLEVVKRGGVTSGGSPDPSTRVMEAPKSPSTSGKAFSSSPIQSVGSISPARESSPRPSNSEGSTVAPDHKALLSGLSTPPLPPQYTEPASPSTNSSSSSMYPAISPSQQHATWPSRPDAHPKAASSGVPHNTYIGDDERSDLRALLLEIPTKSVMDSLLQKLELSHKKDIAALQQDVRHVGQRVAELEETQEKMQGSLATYDQRLNEQAQMLSDLANHIDDLENRHRRNNIRIRGLPEEIGWSSLESWAEAFFNRLLEQPADSPIEIDRIHRTLGPKPSDPSRPRDVLCRVHFYKTKELILQKARELGDLSFQGKPISIFPDLSRRTLQLRRALKPILNALKDNDIQYRWGFPLQLIARKNGKTAVFRNLGDLPNFLGTFELPHIAIPDWPRPNASLPPPPRMEWQTVKPRRPRGRQNYRDSDAA